MTGYQVFQGDCREVMGGFADATFDAVVTDPPYGLDFMGRKWDSFGGASRTATQGAAYQAWCEEWARECLRVLKPGGHLAAFGGTRTYHRLACAIEDAGFEIRDSLHWIFAGAYPKSRDISKAIDEEAGAKREYAGEGKYAARKPRPYDGGSALNISVHDSRVGNPITTPATAGARQWQGWGTALRPSHEPVVVARKPLGKGRTVAASVLEHGTGGINIDGCRVPTTDHWEASGRQSASGTTYAGSANGALNVAVSATHEAGRWPADVIFAHSPHCSGDRGCPDGCPVAELDRQGGFGSSKSRVLNRGGARQMEGWGMGASQGLAYGDSGGTSRFFPVFRYMAKAPQGERPRLEDGTAHVTVKPVGLMRWLVRLVTPPGGLILDPFAGTGTTGGAAMDEGFRCVLIEREESYCALIRQRLDVMRQPTLWDPE